MAADGSVVIEILGDAKDITSKLAGIAGGAVKTLTAAIAGVGTALSGVSAAAIKVGSGFESSMSQVAATMGLSVEEIQNGSAEFEILSNAAKDAGATTAFSASEAADALNYLALAGYDAETAASVLPSVLNLAAAGGMDLAYASDLATDAMAALGIEASNENLTNFGDQLAKTASKSNTSVAQLGEAILTVGGTAKSLAGGTTELNAALGVLANRGIKGAEGGTALRNVILSLSAPTSKAAGQLERLGVSVYDAEGNMRPLNETFEDLNAALAGMTEGEKTEVLNDIFNKVDLKSAQALLAGTGEEFDALAEAIENSQGAMQDMADVQLDNLNGDITILKSGLEGLGIALYETMQVNARDAVQSITGAIGEISNALTTGGIPAAIEVAGQQIAQFATAIAAQAPAIIGAAVSLIQSFLQGIRDNLPELVAAALDIVSSLAAGILELLPDIAETGIEILVALADGIIEAIPQMSEQLPEIITSFVEFMAENLPTIIDKGIELLMALTDGIVGAIPGLVENLPRIIGAIVTFFYTNMPKILAAGVEMTVKLSAGLISAIPQLVAQIPQILSAIVSGLSAGVSSVKDVGTDLIKGLWNGISDMAEWIKKKIDGFGKDVLDKLKDFFGIKSPSRVMRDEVGVMLAEGLAKGIENGAETLNEATKDVAEIIMKSMDDMNANLEKSQQEAANRAAAKELADYEEKIKEKYQKLVSADKKEREKLQREIESLEADWNEKQLKAQEDADQKLLNAQIKGLEATQKEYEKAYSNIEKNRENLTGRLQDYGDLFSTKKIDGKDTFSVNDLQSQIDNMNAFADAFVALREKGADKSLLDEILSMNTEDATKFSQALLKKTDEDFKNYLAKWEEKQNLAAQIATGIYEEDFEALNTEFLEKVPDVVGELSDEMKPVGEKAIQALADGMAEKGAEAVSVAKAIADNVTEQLSKITDLSARLKNAVETESGRLSAQLTISSNAPAEARSARDRTNAAQNAAASAAYGGNRSNETLVVKIGAKEFYRGTLDDLRQVEDETPRTVDDV